MLVGRHLLEREPSAPRQRRDVTELADEPLLRLNSSFASHAWFAAACQVASGMHTRATIQSAGTADAFNVASTMPAVTPVAPPCSRAKAGQYR